MELLDDILDTDLSEEASEVGHHLLDTGAAIVGPVAVAGIVLVGLKKILDGFGN
ncbi:MAG: hypothetical protein PHI63_06050 [Patescibacteria group bacterium]|nr:hypothetical protein [Patescibacteria group bacterium]